MYFIVVIFFKWSAFHFLQLFSFNFKIQLGNDYCRAMLGGEYYLWKLNNRKGFFSSTLVEFLSVSCYVSSISFFSLLLLWFECSFLIVCTGDFGISYKSWWRKGLIMRSNCKSALTSKFPEFSSYRLSTSCFVIGFSD